ncbi:MAG: cytochrome c maturation protein CcmE [Alphaproteobacteria bacterium]|nr:cytochrome c maturation protein CcmE [Rhodobiaceae bacterium]MBG53466.1 cytochrome c maturation protein CcmE [Rhodobiaceae bacterium]MBO6541749.1 cytochrome c maturation protein CcmE [Alphaproteobacteria bacterium]MBO6628856.1 cytochrome c maturation protein CcmE [Alphaproteobacteria bacterium]MDF1625943.1 cytochrome c maturation protein CcmE [Parvibaculaceae bacterium]
MTRKQRRATLIGASLAILAVAVGLVLFALEDSIVFFYSPSEVSERGLETGTRMRLGGLVVEGSIVRGQGTEIRFDVTDFAATIPVTYVGILPDLFREGQGVVAEGVLLPEGVFSADTVLAKHDENYMPSEVADALKRTGNWQGDGEVPHSETYGQGAYP